MVNLVGSAESVFSSGAGFVRSELQNVMVQNAVFAAFTFLIVAHPSTFQFVDSVLNVKNKNMLLFVHASVVALIMYFGSMFLFGPALNLLVGSGNGSEGYKNSKKSI